MLCFQLFICDHRWLSARVQTWRNWWYAISVRGLKRCILEHMQLSRKQNHRTDDHMRHCARIPQLIICDRCARKQFHCDRCAHKDVVTFIIYDLRACTEITQLIMCDRYARTSTANLIICHMDGFARIQCIIGHTRSYNLYTIAARPMNHMGKAPTHKNCIVDHIRSFCAQFIIYNPFAPSAIASLITCERYAHIQHVQLLICDRQAPLIIRDRCKRTTISQLIGCDVSCKQTSHNCRRCARIGSSARTSLSSWMQLLHAQTSAILVCVLRNWDEKLTVDHMRSLRKHPVVDYM